MALEAIKQVTGRGVHVPGNDIDTDRIIPARFLKCVTFDGLGQNLFRDVRFAGDGDEPIEHPLNDPRFAGATVLISNLNFGCGSSREHAPQAIAKAGFNAIVAESFAEIFFGNATTLGIPCVSLGHDDVVSLAARVEAAPETAITVDMEAALVRAGEDLSFPLTIKPAAREALIAGQWDPIAQLLEARDRIDELAGTLPYLDADRG